MFCNLHVVMANDHYNLTLVVKSPRLIEVDVDGVLENLLPKVITNLTTRKRIARSYFPFHPMQMNQTNHER
jgi:hypothetical protein